MGECSFDSHSTTPPLTRCVSFTREFAPEDNWTEKVRRKRKQVSFTEADMSRVHQQYLDQIDSLEAVIQEKEIQLHRYQQTIADQACEIAALSSEVSYLKSRELANDPERRATLLESLCENRVERLMRKVRPAIVKINLAVGRLADVCDQINLETEKAESFLDLPTSSPFCVIDNAAEVEPLPRRDTEPYSRTTILRAGAYEDEAFQRCKQELLLRPAKPEFIREPGSPRQCEMCAALNRQVEKLQVEIRKHKKFISEMKGSIEGLVTE